MNSHAIRNRHPNAAIGGAGIRPRPVTLLGSDRRGSLAGHIRPRRLPLGTTSSYSTSQHSKEGIPAVTASIFRPNLDDLAMTRQGQLMRELLNGTATGNMPGCPLSAAVVTMAPGHRSHVHQHDHTWIIVLLWDAGAEGAITRYGPNLEHEHRQHIGELLVVAPGVPHVAINPSRTQPVVAFEIRSSTDMGADNRVLPDMQHLVSPSHSSTAKTSTPCPSQDSRNNEIRGAGERGIRSSDHQRHRT